MSDPNEVPPVAGTIEPRRRGRPPRDMTPLPPSPWVSPDIAAARIGVSIATLWRGVAEGRITPPAYPSEKSPRFNIEVLDADMVRGRAKPSENEAGRRAARLAEARLRARASRSATKETAVNAQP